MAWWRVMQLPKNNPKSSGIFGYPKRDAWRVALTACADWLHEHGALDMGVTFCVLSRDLLELVHDVFGKLGFPGSGLG